MREEFVANKEDLIVEVINSKFVFKGNLNGKAMIIPCKEGSLVVNGEIVKEARSVKATDEIIYNGVGQEGTKSIKLEVNKDKTNAYITIEYNQGTRYELLDKFGSNILILEAKEIQAVDDNYYEDTDIVKFLRENKVIYGIDYSGIQKNHNKSVTKLLVAKGIPAIEDEEDRLELIDTDDVKRDVDTLRKVDFKSLNNIKSVKAQDPVASIKIGAIGKDGVNVYGEKIPKKNKKVLNIQCEGGCTVRDNKIIALIDGRPVVKGNKISVNNLYTHQGDVDIKTGNVDFLGDVKISGDIKEGMKVRAKGNVIIEGSVYNSLIESATDINIQKSIVSSQIIGGRASVHKEKILISLGALKNDISEILTTVVYLKEKNINTKTYSDGAIIKSLIETKFKGLNTECMTIISGYMKDGITNNPLINVIKGMLMGANILKIKKYNELTEVLIIIDEEIQVINEELALKYDVNFAYCQDAVVKTNGDINIVGKGMYTSQLESFNDIRIKSANSVCRGGSIRAKNTIEINTVGSEGGVKTLLEVQKDGHIYLNKAYRNTIIVVGGKKYVFEYDCQKVHAYISKGELVVDKLHL